MSDVLVTCPSCFGLYVLNECSTYRQCSMPACKERDLVPAPDEMQSLWRLGGMDEVAEAWYGYPREKLWWVVSGSSIQAMAEPPGRSGDSADEPPGGRQSPTKQTP